jgi:peptidyl-prolyl cis-trans isomerase B (cyclophilin B)
MRRSSGILIAMFLMAAALETLAGQGRAAQKPAAPGQKPAAPVGLRPAGAAPVLVIETVKGTIEIETYPNEAPKTVEHILALVKRNFYNGQRIHRVVPGFVVQFGDPQTRDMTKRDRWGSGGSGRAIGVSEVNPKRTHRLGAVAMAHAGDGREADSQMYITLAPQPRLDRDFTVFGQVTSGMDVAQKLAMNDVIRRITVKP